jgi:hypothetical protein
VRVHSQQPLLGGFRRVQPQQAPHHQLEQVNPLGVLQVDPAAAAPARHLSRAHPEQLSEAAL